MKMDTSQTETKLKQTASVLAEKAEDVAQTFGENVEAAAEVVRDRLPQEGRMGQASNVLSDQLATVGRYLQRDGVRGLVGNMETVIRRYPMQSLLLGAGLGYLLSRLHRS
jgi:hypothetical protein